MIESRLMSLLEVDSNMVVENIELAHKINDEHRRDMNIIINGSVGTEGVEENLSILVLLKRGVCEKCSRIAGKYYESILQVRGEGFTLDRNTKERIIGIVVDEIDRTAKKGSGLIYFG